MKKSRIISAVLLAVLMMTVSGAACSKDSDSSSSGSSSASEKVTSGIVGKWAMKLDEEKFNETYSSYDEEAKSQGKMIVEAMKMSVEFKDGGKALVYNAMMGDAPLETTWTQNGDEYILEETKKEESNMSTGIERTVFKLDGDKLIPQADDEMMKCVYFVKE